MHRKANVMKIMLFLFIFMFSNRLNESHLCIFLVVGMFAVSVRIGESHCVHAMCCGFRSDFL